MPYYSGLSRLFERIDLFIWKMRHHDEMIMELEMELEQAQDEIAHLRGLLARTQDKTAKKEEND